MVVSGGVDGVFDVTDPLPFLGLHFMQVRSGAANGALGSA